MNNENELTHIEHNKIVLVHATIYRIHCLSVNEKIVRCSVYDACSDFSSVQNKELGGRRL